MEKKTGRNLNRVERKQWRFELYLKMKSLVSSQCGVEVGSGSPIVSLTSYPPRFAQLHICLESILNQSVKPSRLLLWIAKQDMSSLPKKVVKLQDRGLEIKECEDIKSYKKLIFALEEYPQSSIVTADDDILYPHDWLATLFEAHKSNPAQIICHRARYITFNAAGELNQYRYWPNIQGRESGGSVIPVGTGGVLYPPGSLAPPVFDSACFMEICAHGDDIWFKAMSVLAATSCLKLDRFKHNFFETKGAHLSALQTSNLNGRNDQQIAAVFSRFEVTAKLKFNDSFH
ncbi:glycosyltransferase family A protein [Hahella chejuensis]|uniref:glycosyltransferase family A protein n=1 Tax=Hahella chejuensis TaxID=158327 RepID=UPI000318A811|nr:glycosyltransferase family A protein [Hahella chejuensis]